MTHIGEIAAINLADQVNDDKCPFCYKTKHSFASKKSEPDARVVSKPDALGCHLETRKDGNLPYTTAQHHLISAKQCYGQIRRLVRMGSAIGYDINNRNNGIGLPSTHWTLKYRRFGKNAKYGDFNNDEKRKIAFELMEERKAQWHVGHHSFVIKTPGDWSVWQEQGADEKDDNDRGHEVGYDTQIITKLLAIYDRWIQGEFCQKEPDSSENLKADMDKLSKEIGDLLRQFSGGEPWKSSPLFVSVLAYEYALEKSKSLGETGGTKRAHGDSESENEPPPSPSKKRKISR